jgi:hypothetical protein
MSYTVELRPDIASIVVAINRDFSMQDDLQPLCQEVIRTLDQSNRPLYYISDARQLSLTLDELIQGTNALVRGQYPFATHRNFKAMLLITSDSLISMAATGMRSDSFGNVHVEIFSSIDDAVAFVRSQP